MPTLDMNTEEMKAFVLDVTREAALETQEAECNHYGTFLTGLSRKGLEATFWVPFVTVFVLLILAATSHQKSERAYMHGKHHPEEAAHIKLEQRRWRIGALVFTTLAALLVIVCVILEALAGCALTYCLKHKLIWFYWGMWTLTQVGSLVAITGVTIHQWACLGEHSTPPWNIALGTPILVIAGAAHIIGSLVVKKVRKWASGQEPVPCDRSIYNPDVLGKPVRVAQKLDGGVIVEYPCDYENRKPVFGERILGHNEFGGVIVEYPPPPQVTEIDMVAEIGRPGSGVGSQVTLTPARSVQSGPGMVQK